MSSRGNIKREVDLQTMVQWIAPQSRVLDLGCGRGIFLEHLRQTRQTYGVGVERNPGKIASCIKRGVNVYQGDAESALSIFEDNTFDWVVCSRMLDELENPQAVLTQALRVARHVAVGFINFGFWESRLHMLRHGQRPQNEVYPKPWHSSRPSNPLTVKDFERFCQNNGFGVEHRVFLDRSWRNPVNTLPNLLAGYAVYAIGKPN